MCFDQSSGNQQLTCNVCASCMCVNDLVSLSLSDDEFMAHKCSIALEKYMKNRVEHSYYYCTNCAKLLRATDKQMEPKPCDKCAEFESNKKNDSLLLEKYYKEHAADTKKCPKCAFRIEKKDGCNHMQCTACHTHFCWLCMFVGETGDMVYVHQSRCTISASASDL